MIRFALRRVFHYVHEGLRRRSFAAETHKLLRLAEISPGDLVFVPNASHVELAAVIDVLQRKPACRASTWHLLFRRDLNAPAGCPDPRHLLRDLFQKAERCGSARCLRLWTDSDGLTTQYQDLASVRFDTLPIPHTAPAVPRSNLRSGPCKMLFLGDARIEKGFQHLPDIVSALMSPNGTGSDEVAFEFQAYSSVPRPEPAVEQSRERLRRFVGMGVTLWERPLAPPEYNSLLGRGDLVLFPYEQAAYAARTSGVYVEALSAGIPVLVPQQTWMARRLPSGTGLVYREIAEIPKLIRMFMAHREAYRRAATAFAGAWRAEHNAHRLLNMLRSSPDRGDDCRCRKMPRRLYFGPLGA